MPNWGQVIAYLINTVLVVLIVNYLTGVWPTLKERYPWLPTIASTVIAPLLTVVAEWLTGLLGYKVDLSPIIGVITGLIAIAGYDIGHGIGKAAVYRAMAKMKGGRK